MKMSLTYKMYKKNRFAVYGDRKKHGKEINAIGGRWNKSLPDGPGWTLSITKEEKLKAIIEKMKELDNIDQIKINGKSRKNQKQEEESEGEVSAVEEESEGEVSAVEEESEGEAAVVIKNKKPSRYTQKKFSHDSDSDDEELIKKLKKEYYKKEKEKALRKQIQKEMRRRVKSESSKKYAHKLKKYQVDPELIRYYKKYGKRPKKRIVQSLQESSESEDDFTNSESSESEDDYPSFYKSPRRKSKGRRRRS
jgi:hypothetical protein